MLRSLRDADFVFKTHTQKQSCRSRAASVFGFLGNLQPALRRGHCRLLPRARGHVFCPALPPTAPPTAPPTGVGGGCLTVVSMCTSLVIRDTEQVFTYLLDICMSPRWRKRLFESLARAVRRLLSVHMSLFTRAPCCFDYRSL